MRLGLKNDVAHSDVCLNQFMNELLEPMVFNDLCFGSLGGHGFDDLGNRFAVHRTGERATSEPDPKSGNQAN